MQWWLLTMAVLVSTSLAGSVRADDWAEYSAPIVNGVVTQSMPSTGALLVGSNAGNADIQCSGTLIGCQTFLTAAHCVCEFTGAACQGAGAPNPSNYFVFLQHGGIHRVTAITLRSDFDFPVGDVAVIHLGAPITGIRPTSINTQGPPPAGTVGVISGFGRSGGNSEDYGILRRGDVHTASCLNGVSNSTSVCWSFDAPLGSPGTNSNTCNGDSGGPLFVDLGNGPVVAGITSGGESVDCLARDDSYDANVYTYHNWIQSQAGADLGNAACGDLPQVGDPGTAQADFNGMLATGGGAQHTFTVPAGADLLRVTMNSVADFDLYVRAGNPASVANADCRQDGVSGFAACEFSNPTPGTWYVLVQAFTGSGAYQVTATRFGVDCSDPGAAGLACDDGNSCTVTDKCQAGVCRGTALPDDSNCDDGNLCTHPDRCSAGVCVGGTEPATNCHSQYDPKAGTVRVRHSPSRGDTLSWRWLKGRATAQSEFGDPINATPYALCVYDQIGGVNTLAMQQAVPAGGQCGKRPCWVSTMRGFRYANRDGSGSGLSHIELRDGADGKAQVVTRGRGADLSLPPLPLHQDRQLTVQLTNGTSCWESTYQSNKRNTEVEFRAAPGP